MPETKVCSKCGNKYPATTEFFYSRKEGKDGLRNDCKNVCLNTVGNTLKIIGTKY